jgi:TRAP-type C4-dicarboxylate transport system substrate-binding protein
MHKETTMKFRAALACIPLALVAASASVSAQQITIRLGDNLPKTHFLARNGTSYFMEEVTKQTNGAVKFEYYPSEQLGKAKDMLQLVRAGVVDIGLVVPSYVSDRMPLSGVMDLPGSLSSSCEATMTFWSMVNGGWLAKQEYEPNGIRVVFAYVNPPYQLFFSKDNFRKLDDMKGMKIRSVGGALDITLRKLNAVPVRMTAPEVHESLSRGTVDGMVFPVPTVISYDMQKLIKVATIGENFGTVATSYVISEAKWKELPQSVRDVVMKVGEATTRRVCEMTDQDVITTYDKFKTEGINLVTLPASDKQRLQSEFKEIRQEWASFLDKRGKPGTKTVEAFDEAAKRAR